MSLSKPYKMDDTRYKRVLVYSRYVLVVININVTYFMYDSVYSSAFDFCDNI